MITNSLSVNGLTRKKSFRVLTAVIAVLFVCSVTFTAFATTNDAVDVTVTDGEKSVSISTKETAPIQIAHLAGFNLDANDKIDTSGYNAEEGGTIVIEKAKVVRVEDSGIVSYFVGYGDTLGSMLSGEGFVFSADDDLGENPAKKIFDGMRVFIKRAFGVTIDSDGESQKVFLSKGTVADVIEKAGITLNGDDIVTPSLNTVVDGSTNIRIFRVTYETHSEKQSIDFATRTIPCADMFVGEEEIVTKGVAGEKHVFYTDKYIDGVLEETVFSKEKVITEAINEVKKVGTKQRVTLAAFKNTDAPISDLDVPSDLKLDKNGIPVDYAYCVEGKATAYTGDPATASGRKPMPGHIAVDPKEFPYGTELYVVSADGSYVYGYCVAADTGGFVKMGNTDIDLYMDNKDMCTDWGNRNVKIYVLN
ncbi:MAG: G5 domain-containing protein [Clostridia bacterium]|nr:G5 domain-containing protein [Clostridia bacterium]